MQFFITSKKVGPGPGRVAQCHHHQKKKLVLISRDIMENISSLENENQVR
jgi:hypothetical protein